MAKARSCSYRGKRERLQKETMGWRALSKKAIKGCSEGRGAVRKAGAGHNRSGAGGDTIKPQGLTQRCS